MKGIVRITAAALLCATLFTGCGGMENKNSAVGFHMDTVIMLTGYCDEALLTDAIALCGRYEKLLSRTVEGSDVWKINHAGGDPVKISADTAKVLSLALDVCEKSGGALDITIAPAVDLWDFKGEEPALPRDEDIAAAMEKVDYTKVMLEVDTVTIPKGMEIDLGAVAKGYIADRAAEFLKENGVQSAALNFGGNVIALGSKPDGSPWNIGIQDPDSQTGESIAVVEVKDRSVVTSGVYQRGFDMDGIRYHHILDTDTGWPVQNGVSSVTIIAEGSARADALSTACFAMGRDGLDFAREMGAEAVIVFSDGSIECTKGAEELLVDG